MRLAGNVGFDELDPANVEEGTVQDESRSRPDEAARNMALEGYGSSADKVLATQPA